MTSKSSENKMAKLQEELLSDLTAEQRQYMKEKLGLKQYQRVFGHIEKEKAKVKKTQKGPQPKADKSKPLDAPAKQRVDRLSRLPKVKERIARDPSRDDISGKFREDVFNRDYAFLGDLRAKEKQKVQKQLKKEKNAEKKQKLQQLLNKMVQQEQASEAKQSKKKRLQEWKEKERERVKEGKAPYFLKKSDVRKLELANKFRALKQKGQVARQIEKKRRRNAAKEKKKGMLD